MKNPKHFYTSFLLPFINRWVTESQTTCKTYRFSRVSAINEIMLICIRINFQFRINWCKHLRIRISLFFSYRKKSSHKEPDILATPDPPPGGGGAEDFKVVTWFLGEKKGDQSKLRTQKGESLKILKGFRRRTTQICLENKDMGGGIAKVI